MENKFTGYVLAGGKSSRMKRDKAFLPIGDRTFLENAVEILTPVCESVKVILNKSQEHFIEKLPADISHIFDIFENRGALGGIHSAFRDCETEFAVILAVDLPIVSSELIAKLSEIAISSSEFSVFVPRQNDGRLQPLCAIYRASDCLSEIEFFLKTENSASVNGFLKKITNRIIERENLADKKDVFLNVNEPQDFKHFCAGRKFKKLFENSKI